MGFTKACIFLLLAGCSSSSATAVPDGGATTHPHDATLPNTCTAAHQGYVCQSTFCASNGLVDIEDYFCGSSSDFCCGTPGEGGLDASNDVNVFVDGTVFETGNGDAGAPHDAASDVKADATGDATSDATHPTDGSPSGDASHDASGSMTSDGGMDAPRG
jgi:hypothetical protein